VGPLLSVLLLAACGSGESVSPEEAAALAAAVATTGPVAYTTTYAFELPAPLGTVAGTIEGRQDDPEDASFVVSATGTAPRTLTLDASNLGRLAVVPTDVLGLVGGGDALEADGTGRGFGQDEVDRFRQAVDPMVLQAPTVAFVAEVVGWIEGSPVPRPVALTVTGGMLELLVLSDGSSVDSAVLRVDYEIDGTAGSASIRLAITG
jgi:hypothetical protein